MSKLCRDVEHVENVVREASASSTLLHGYKQNDGGVDGGVNGGVISGKAKVIFDTIVANLGLRKVRHCERTGINDRTLKRYLAHDLSKLVEFRGAPKTGGYYAK